MRLVTPELVCDLWAPSSPALSPDGAHATWTAAPHGQVGEHREQSIWVADLAAGTPARRWTRGYDDTDPAFSPDGRRIAFRSDRDERGTHGLHVLELDGGDARPLLVRKRSVGGFCWAPDGSSIYLLAPDEPTDDDERREKERDDADVWGERWRHHRLWRVPVGDEVTDAELVWAPDRHLAELAVSPDGATVAALVRRSPLLEHVPTIEVWCHDSDGPRLVCAAPSADQLAWCGPDTLVFAADHDWRPQGGSTVWAVDAAAGAPRVVGTQVDEERCITTLRADASGRLVVVVADRLETRLERVDVTTGQRRVLVASAGDLGRPSICVVADEVVAAVVAEDPGQPVGRISALRGGELSPVPGQPVAGSPDDVRLAIAEALTATAPDGTEIDAVLLRPLDAGAGPWPTVVLPHGGPYGRDTLDAGPYPLGGGWGQLLAARGYAVVMPNYRGGLGRGHAFAVQARGDMGGAEWADVEAVVDAAIAAGAADPDRLGIGGWSQGGFLTAWAVTATDRYRAAVMGAGVSDWSMMAATSDLPDFESELGGSVPWDGPGPHHAAVGSPISYASRCTTPLLMLHGADDARVPAIQATAFHRALRDQDVPVELVTYPREPHGVRERAHQIDLQERVVAWFDHHLR